MNRRTGRDFPQLGDPDGRVSTSTRVRFFVTAPGARVALCNGSTSTLGGPFHAKSMGTARTACGMDASSWKKLWDVPFSKNAGPLCHDCVQAVAGVSAVKY